MTHKASLQALRFRYSFICQGTSIPGDSEVTFSVFESFRVKGGGGC